LGSLVGLTEFAYIALLVWLGTHGPGPLSLDALVARRSERSGTHATMAATACRSVHVGQPLRRHHHRHGRWGRHARLPPGPLRQAHPPPRARRLRPARE